MPHYKYVESRSSSYYYDNRRYTERAPFSRQSQSYTSSRRSDAYDVPRYQSSRATTTQPSRYTDYYSGRQSSSRVQSYSTGQSSRQSQYNSGYALGTRANHDSYYQPEYRPVSYTTRQANHYVPKSHTVQDWGHTGGYTHNGDLERFSRHWPRYSEEKSARKYAAKGVAHGARSAFKASGADVGLGAITLGLQGLGLGVTKMGEFLFGGDKKTKHHRRRR